MFGGSYHKTKVLITGHTGFKGSWLALWLRELSANIIGYSLNPPTEPNHFDLLTKHFTSVISPITKNTWPSFPDLIGESSSFALDIPVKPEYDSNFISVIADICNAVKLNETFRTYQPEIVFHMAAQPLVRYSYKNPVETFETNVMGTINVFEACRNTDSVRAVINVTSDKCYENREWVWGYRENDPLGGHDPYSASKGCAELVTSAYRRSFFANPPTLQSSNPQALLASVRAGNVIGGGDWADDRLIPDIMRAVNKNEKVIIRNPKSTRPWQHVLEPLSGYLMIGQKLLGGIQEFAEAWNFGPGDESNINVETVVKRMKEHWNKIDYDISPSHLHIFPPSEPHEAALLKLDCSKAHSKLGWKPVWDFDRTVSVTARWYKEFYENGKWNSRRDLDEYIQDAKNKNLSWTI